MYMGLDNGNGQLDNTEGGGFALNAITKIDGVWKTIWTNDNKTMTC
jgi:hypothetical protein